MWDSIDNAPKNGVFILIRQPGCYVPDLVQWLNKHKHRLTIEGHKNVLDIPEGWFTRSGQRSIIRNPTEYFLIPE
jgi:hypothetical protein